MRLHHALLLIPLLSAPIVGHNALAQTVAASTAPEHHGRRSAAEHFADANTTHDGHLTLDQATSGYKSIAKTFSQIDINHHGYITTDDIKAWRAAKKAAKQATKRETTDASDGVIRPTSATLHGSGPSATNASSNMVVPASPRMGGGLPRAQIDGGPS